MYRYDFSDKVEGTTKKEKLLNLLRSSNEEHITLCIVSPDKEHSEYITVFRQDFKYKAENIDREYDSDLRLHRNDRVKIDCVLGLTFAEEVTYIY